MSSSLFGSSHGLEEFEKDGIEQAMARIEWASSQIQKKVKYKRPVGVEQKEIETNLSQLISTILAWAQRPLPTTNQRSNQLPPDARRLIRHIFHLTEKALSVNEISSEFGKMLDEKARELVEILRIDPIDSSSIWEPPGIEGDDGDDPNLKGINYKITSISLRDINYTFRPIPCYKLCDELGSRVRE